MAIQDVLAMGKEDLDMGMVYSPWLENQFVVVEVDGWVKEV